MHRPRIIVHLTFRGDVEARYAQPNFKILPLMVRTLLMKVTVVKVLRVPNTICIFKIT